MRLRIKKFHKTKSLCHQPWTYKVQRRICFFWFDCESGVDGHMYIPTFSDKEAAIRFGTFYADFEGQIANWDENEA